MALKRNRESGMMAKRRALLDALLQGEGVKCASLDKIPRRQDSEKVPLTFSQQRLWLITQLTPEDTSYNIAAAVRLQGVLDVNALERSLNEIIRRHEALRTTFATVDGQPVQIVAPTMTLEIPTIDLTHLAQQEREMEVQRLARE